MIAIVSCQQESADFTNRLDDLEKRVSKLEQLCQEMNSNISSLQKIVTAMQTGDYITSVKPITEGGKTVGYTISFAKGNPIDIYHGQDGADGKDGKDGVDGNDGKDGADGHTPVIGVKQDTDGIWYWTIDGEWLLDVNGHKVKAVGTDGKDGVDGKDGQDGADGKDGVTPQLKIEDGYWFVSTDNGQTWTKLGKATGEDGKDGTDGTDGNDGDSMFRSVTVTDTEVTFVTSDGQTFVIKRASFLASRIQSLSYIPRYTDRSSTMWIRVLADGSLEARDTLDFHVSPANCVNDIVAAWQTVLTAQSVTAVTRAPSSTAVKIPILSVSGADGILSVVLDGSLMGDVFTSTRTQQNVTIIISDGNNERASEYVGIVPIWKELLAPYAVDLGLSVKWAICNVGAMAIDETGDRYAWGEIELKDGEMYGGWETYKWWNESNNSLTKYIVSSDNGSVDYKTVLDLEDDVAHVKLGGLWRMPTHEEWTELWTQCTWDGNTVTGPNGNSIDLPDIGKYSPNYWSSSLFSPSSTEELDALNPDLLDSRGAWVSGWHDVPYDPHQSYQSLTPRRDRLYVRPVLGEMISVTEITLNKSNLSLDMGTTEQLSASTVPSNATYPVFWHSSNPEIATVSQDGLIAGHLCGETTITAYSSDGMHSASCSVTVLMPAVDLGLSVKWASFNLGATDSKKKGNYYAWGESESRSGFTKYNPNDHKTILDREDDVAAMTLVGNWRMPTKAEWEELQENCTWTQITQNGVSGYLVSATNGNSIFLPATGYYKQNNYKSELDFQNLVNTNYCLYWSSSLFNHYSAWAKFGKAKSNLIRTYRLPIRPVCGEVISVTDITLDKATLSVDLGSTAHLSALVVPSNATYPISWHSSNPQVATVEEGYVTGLSYGTTTITVYSSDGQHFANCSVTVPGPTVDHPAVDLGLSVKWASLNVGATESQIKGNHYAWGETEENSWDWSTYKHVTGGAFSKYNSSDNLIVLNPEDDVASVIWGDGWRMPTYAEWQELRENCTWTLTTQNEVSGYLVSATNGNSIFLPAAGIGYNYNIEYGGIQGFYWSSSLDNSKVSNDYAKAIGFASNNIVNSSQVRCDGLSIRPVLE